MSIADDLRNVFVRKDNGLTKLIIINVIAFILVNILDLFLPATDWLALPANVNAYIYRFWTIFTYMFLHKGIMHIFFNMLWLFWMGRLFVDFLGSQRLVSLYILGGLGGGILFFLFTNITWGMNNNVILLGASASVMAIVVAIAMYIPNYSLHLLFIGPVQLKYIALISFIITTLLDFNVNTGGKVAHLGGAIIGYLFTVSYKKGRDITRPLNHLLEKGPGILFPPRKSKMKVAYKKTAPPSKAELQKQVDEILDKISRSGYESLTKEEKDILFKASNNK